MAPGTGKLSDRIRRDTQSQPRFASRRAQWHLDFAELSAFDWWGTEPSSTREAASGQLGWIKPFCGLVMISATLLGWKATENGGPPTRTKTSLPGSP